MDHFQAPKGSYEDLLSQARDLWENYRYEKAEELYQRVYNRLSKLDQSAFKRRPELEKFLVTSMDGLAQAYHHRKEFEAAATLYQHLLEITPPEYHLEWQHALARLTVDAGQTEVGLDQLRSLAAQNVDKTWLWLSLAEVLFSAGQFAEAEQQFRRVLARKKEPPDKIRLANTFMFVIYRRWQRWKEAEKYWLAAMPADQTINYSGLCRMYFQAGNSERVAYWAGKDPSPISRNFYLGLSAYAGGNMDAAADYWVQATTYDPFDYLQNSGEWIEASLWLNRPPEGIIWMIEQLLKRDAEMSDLLLLLAVAHIRAGQLELAHQACRTFLDEISPTFGVIFPEFLRTLKDEFQLLVTDPDIRAVFAGYFE